jgi:hypothetical protein
VSADTLPRPHVSWAAWRARGWCLSLGPSAPYHNHGERCRARVLRLTTPMRAAGVERHPLAVSSPSTATRKCDVGKAKMMMRPGLVSSTTDGFAATRPIGNTLNRQMANVRGRGKCLRWVGSAEDSRGELSELWRGWRHRGRAAWVDVRVQGREASGVPAELCGW